MTRRNEAKLEYVTSDTPREIAVPILLARILLKCKLTDSGCWEYHGDRSELGYGQAILAGKHWRVHRFMYYAITGEDCPKGLDISHSCHNRACINPYHIRPKTHQENLLESSQAKRLNGQDKTHCKRGHALEGDNVWTTTCGFRQCRLCSRMRYRKRLGWPEHLWFKEIVVPSGYAIDRTTGELIPSRMLRK